MKTYLSVCSGIESATVAWHPLGWRPWAYAEIEPFPSYVLNHHYGSGRPHFMPDPDEAGLPDDDRKERRAARKAVAGLSLSPVGGNSVPNLGDMTQFKEWPDADIDVLVGGTPCQSYSVAGLGKGLDDPRGDLMLTYVAIARRYRPAWVVWENVPGVLSNDGGRAFGTLLGLLTGKRVEVPAGGWQTAGAIEGYKSAYGIAWRILDSQFVRVDGFGRAVPQRRRRVFVVGYLGDWRRAAAVLFERAGMSGDPAPRRKAGEKIAGTISSRPAGSGGLGTDFDLDGGLTVAHTLSAARGAAAANMADLETYLPVVLTLSESSGHARPGDNIQSSDYLIPVGQSYVPDIVPQAMSAKWSKGSSGPAGDEVANLVAFNARQDPIAADDGTTQAFAFKASHFTRGKDGAPADVFPPLSADADKGDQDPLVCAPIAFDCKAGANTGFAVGDVPGALRGDGHGGGHTAIAFSAKDHGADAGEVSPTLRSMGHDGSHANGGGQVAIAFDTTQITNPDNRSNPQPGGPSHPLSAQADPPAIVFQPRYARNGRGAPDVVASALTSEAGETGKGDSAQCVAFGIRSDASRLGEAKTPSADAEGRVRLRDPGLGIYEEIAPTVDAGQAHTVATAWAVRRLTPVECERLQAMPDGYTNVPWRGADEAPDGPRYKALGNSMSANVMRWIGMRIDMVDAIFAK